MPRDHSAKLLVQHRHSTSDQKISSVAQQLGLSQKQPHQRPLQPSWLARRTAEHHDHRYSQSCRNSLLNKRFELRLGCNQSSTQLTSRSHKHSSSSYDHRSSVNRKVHSSLYDIKHLKRLIRGLLRIFYRRNNLHMYFPSLVFSVCFHQAV